MRRLSMRNKRRKSETSDSETGENGGARAAISDDESQSKNDELAESIETPKPASKKRSRGTPVYKTHVDDKIQAKDETILESEEQENGGVAKTINKRRKKDQKASTSSREKSPSDESEYEVEKIMAYRTIKGRRQFLIRWKGYGESADSWENEKDLNCSKLIENFLSDEEDNEDIIPVKVTKPAKTKSSKANKSKKSKDAHKKQIEDDEGTGDNKDASKEFEVEKILDVYFKKNGVREFLIRWKGFSPSDDTWEPEKNLNCPELITKFMQKVEKAKTTDLRELRANRAHTKRYTLTTHDSGRRLSRRNIDKQRATYHECDE